VLDPSSSKVEIVKATAVHFAHARHEFGVSFVFFLVAFREPLLELARGGIELTVRLGVILSGKDSFTSCMLQESSLVGINQAPQDALTLLIVATDKVVSSTVLERVGIELSMSEIHPERAVSTMPSLFALYRVRSMSYEYVPQDGLCAAHGAPTAWL
jgi:hypothetical protein